MNYKFGTGQSINEIIVSVDNKMQPVSGATFQIDVYKFGVPYSGVLINMELVNADTGVFKSSWSADTLGDYQLIYKNEITNVFFVTDIYQVVSDNELNTNIYIGL